MIFLALLVALFGGLLMGTMVAVLQLLDRVQDLERRTALGAEVLGAHLRAHDLEHR